MIRLKRISVSCVSCVSLARHSVQKNEIKRGRLVGRREFKYFSTAAEDTEAPRDDHLEVSSSKSVEPVIGKTLPEFLWERVLSWNNALAFECHVTGRSYTYAQLYRYSRGFATALLKEGLSEGDILAVVLPNVPEYYIALLGSMEAGLIPTTVNPACTSYEIAKQLQDCQAKAILILDTHLSSFLKIKAQCPHLSKIILLNNTGGSIVPPPCLSLFSMITTVPADPPTFTKGNDHNTLKTPAEILYSTGATGGSPKGVMLSHSNLTTNILQYIHALGRFPHLGQDGWDGDRFLGILPFSHSYGNMISILAIYQGAKILCLPKFEPTMFLTAVRKQRPTILFTVPSLIHFLAKSPQQQFGHQELTQTGTIVCSAAPMASNLVNQVLDRARHDLSFVEAFGMTELTRLSHMARRLPRSLHHRQGQWGRVKIGTSGPPVANTVCKIVAVDGSERSLGPDEKGELQIKGPQVMLGYLNNPGATQETIDSEGWLHTGDIAYYDQDGDFFVVDRMKELIKVKGLQVAPSELEDLLKEHPGIKDAAVIGIPDFDGRNGELPRAYIVCKDHCENINAEEINAFIQPRLAKFKHLKGGIEFLSKIPKSVSGKVLRRQLLEQYKEEYG